MKKQKTNYRYYRYEGDILHAKREIPFAMRLSTRLLLDELCFHWNKKQLEKAINDAIDNNNKQAFLELSKQYQHFVWE